MYNSGLGRLGHHFFFRFLRHTLPLLLLLLVFLAFGLRLQNIVHEVVNVHIRKLFIDSLTLLVLRLEFLPLPLVHSPLLLIGALPLLAEALVLMDEALLCHAATHTFSSLELPLMILELVTVTILVLASLGRLVALGAFLPLRLAHLLVLLLQL